MHTRIFAPALATLTLAAAPAAAGALAVGPPPAPATAPAAATSATVLVKGPEDKATVGPTDLRAMRRYSVTVPWGGGHTYSGAALSELLAEIGAPSEARLHGPPLDQVVIVKGRDGFIAVLAMAETAMSFKGQPVILADEKDGKPLDAKEGPYRLVIGGELKPPRSVWGVVEVELRPIR